MNKIEKDYKTMCKIADWLSKQKNIEAISISSYNREISEVDSRYVNLKLVTNDEFIFFSNYNSPKASSFNSHNQIAALVYWPSINVQIRMRANLSLYNYIVPRLRIK